MKSPKPIVRNFFFLLHLGLFLFAISIGISLPAYAQISADHWLGGAVRVGTSVSNCDGTIAGAIRYDSGAGVLKYCDGAIWRTLGATVAGADSTPDSFSFTDVTSQPLSTMIFSNTITISGIDPDQTVSVTGAGTPQISVNNGPWVTASSISAGDELRVRLISAAATIAQRDAVVTVGTLSDTWSVTTREERTRLFLTSVAYAGNFGGIAGADAICMTRAGAAGLPGVWKAVISDSTIDVKDRLTIIYPVVNLLGAVMAGNNFYSESINSNVYSEFGGAFSSTAQRHFWSGSGLGGVKVSQNCDDWTTTAGTGRSGQLNGSFFYFSGNDVNCNQTDRRIACMEQ